jgi:hypothetical protein
MPFNQRFPKLFPFVVDIQDVDAIECKLPSFSQRLGAWVTWLHLGNGKQVSILTFFVETLRGTNIISKERQLTGIYPKLFLIQHSSCSLFGIGYRSQE